MQDRYAGDVGDFLKYGLLRWIAAPAADGSRLTLGVLWYLAADESHNEDGKHVTYLDPTTPAGGQLRELDPDLHRRLASVVAIERSVAEVERSGALPTGTRTFNERLDLSDLPAGGRSARIDRRTGWLDRALDALADCDVVFADPDNGIRLTDHSNARHLNKSEKHAYLDELAAFADRGQAVIVYHHADRSAPVSVQIQRRLADLGAAIDDPIAAVRASRGTTRLFLVAGSGDVARQLRERLVALESSAWMSELTVHWFDPDVANAPTPSPNEAEAAPSASRPQQFSPECHRLVTEVAAAWGTITTLTDGRPNRIVDVTDTGVLVETAKSAGEGDGPKLVSAWMVEVAWEHLRTQGSLQQSHLVATDGLNVKRSAFVMALLSKIPGVTIASSRPSELTFRIACPPIDGR